LVSTGRAIHYGVEWEDPGTDENSRHFQNLMRWAQLEFFEIVIRTGQETERAAFLKVHAYSDSLPGT
jgi:hypothetical protein